MSRKLSDRQIEKILKKEKSRRRARGIGAVFGTITSAAVSWLLLAKTIRDHDDK